MVGGGAAELVSDSQLCDRYAATQPIGALDGGVVRELALRAPVDGVVAEGRRVDRAAGVVLGGLRRHVAALIEGGVDTDVLACGWTFA